MRKEWKTWSQGKSAWLMQLHWASCCQVHCAGHWRILALARNKQHLAAARFPKAWAAVSPATQLSSERSSATSSDAKSESESWILLDQRSKGLSIPSILAHVTVPEQLIANRTLPWLELQVFQSWTGVFFFPLSHATTNVPPSHAIGQGNGDREGEMNVDWMLG